MFTEYVEQCCNVTFYALKGGIFTQLQYSYNYMVKFMIHTTTDTTMLYQLCCNCYAVFARFYLVALARVFICYLRYVTAVFSYIPVIRKESYFIIMQLSMLSESNSDITASILVPDIQECLLFHAMRI